MASKKQRISGWVLSVLLAIFLIGPSGMGKFMDWEGKDEMLSKMGIDPDLLVKIGIVEVSLALLFLVPRVAFVAAILLTAYFGGATLTHLRIGEPFVFPIVFGIVTWVALGLRRPEVFALAFRGSSPPVAPGPADDRLA